MIFLIPILPAFDGMKFSEFVNVGRSLERNCEGGREEKEFIAPGGPSIFLRPPHGAR